MNDKAKKLLNGLRAYKSVPKNKTLLGLYCLYHKEIDLSWDAFLNETIRNEYVDINLPLIHISFYPLYEGSDTYYLGDSFEVYCNEDGEYLGLFNNIQELKEVIVDEL